MRILAGLLLGLGIGLVLFFGFPGREVKSAEVAPGNPSIGDPAQAPAPVQGAPAPDFALFNLEGEKVRLSDLRGRIILLNFWATWCAPCRIEMPLLQERFERFTEDGLIVLAVDFDEPRPVVEDFGNELGLTFPILLDPGGEVQGLYRVRGYPSSFFVDRDGLVRIVHIGVMTDGQLDKYLEELGLGS